MTRLEQAQGKLQRLKRESEEMHHLIRAEHDRIPFGQPNIIGRGDIYKKVNGYHDRAIKLLKEQEKQEKRVEMLEKVEDFKEKNELIKDVHVVGKSSYATVGAKTSVNNIDYFKNELKELEKANEKAKAYNKTKPAIKARTFGAVITKLKNKIATLEQMKEADENKVVSERTKERIESGAVTQWKKKPIFYFVKGLRKVALEIDENGEFFISNYYPACTDADKEFISKLLDPAAESRKKETFC
ncbi:hypothetical protein [Enterococcus faecalis]|uniref:hypothetical protein n=1 Tax=Enterococcus faecalis TaxID=1351 RepID=UPI0037E0A9B6|nr:hypothetical protein [Enterococcus faecalis]